MSKTQIIKDQETLRKLEQQKKELAGFLEQTPEEPFDPLKDAEEFHEAFQEDMTRKSVEKMKEFSSQAVLQPPRPEIQEQAKQQESENDQQVGLEIPEDPEKKLEWTVDFLKSLNLKWTPPSVAQLKQWKYDHGRLFLFTVSEDIVVLFRYLKRQEYSQMMAKETLDNMTPMQREDHLCRKCILWPQFSYEEVYGLPGGFYTTLTQQIEYRSGFLPPALAEQLTVSL